MTKIIAHRGTGISNRSYVHEKDVYDRLPENTLISFEEALLQGADGLECDVCCTKDNKIVVIHDDEINLNAHGANRETRELGYIYEYTYSKIKNLDVGLGQNPPLLTELVKLIDKYDKNKDGQRKGLLLSIELKGKGTPEKLATLLNQLIESGYPASMFEVHSFKEEWLKEFKNTCPSVKIGLGIKSKMLFHENDLDGFKAREGASYRDDALSTIKETLLRLDCTQIRPCNRDTKQELIDYCIRNNIEPVVWSWEEEKPEKRKDDYRWLLKLTDYHKKNLNISYLTDYPREAKRFLDSHQNKKLFLEEDLSYAPRILPIIGYYDGPPSIENFRFIQLKTSSIAIATQRLKGFKPEEFEDLLSEKLISPLKSRIICQHSLKDSALNFFSEGLVKKKPESTYLNPFLDNSLAELSIKAASRVPAYKMTPDCSDTSYATFSHIVLFSQNDFEKLLECLNKKKDEIIGIMDHKNTEFVVGSVSDLIATSDKLRNTSREISDLNQQKLFNSLADNLSGLSSVVESSVAKLTNLTKRRNSTHDNSMIIHKNSFSQSAKINV